LLFSGKRVDHDSIGPASRPRPSGEGFLEGTALAALATAKVFGEK